MPEPFAEYAIAHESRHTVVRQIAKIGAPSKLSFRLCRGVDGQLYLGDFATSFRFPLDDEIPTLPSAVKNCLCYTLAAGFATTQFRGLSLPGKKKGLDSDRARLAKLTSPPLEYFIPYAAAVIRQERRAYELIISEWKTKYEQLKQSSVDVGEHVSLDAAPITAVLS